MNLVFSILFFAVALGVFRPRMGRLEWTVLSVWIILVIARYYIKGPLG